MEIEFDPEKRLRTILERNLDFLDVTTVFDQPNITITDDRFEYPEPRFITFGKLRERLVVIVWTQRGENCRVISMRKANDREYKKYGIRLG